MPESIGSIPRSIQYDVALIRERKADENEHRGGRIKHSLGERNSQEAVVRKAETTRTEASHRKTAQAERNLESHAQEEAALVRKETSTYQASGRTNASSDQGRQLSAHA
jgi:hypothetical protein